MKLPIISSDEVIRVLKKAGFSYAPKRGKGSHVAFYKETVERKLLVIIPKRMTLCDGDKLNRLDRLNKPDRPDNGHHRTGRLNPGRIPGAFE